MCPRERSIQGTPLRWILSGKYELGFLNSLLQGPRPCLYSPLGSTTALGSNRPWSTTFIHPQRWWKQDPRGGSLLAPWVGRPPLGLGAHPCHSDRWVPPLEFSFPNLLDYTFLLYGHLSLCKPDMWAIFDYFQLAPYKNRYSPKLVEFYQLNT
jgi:hypothetical protein